MNIDGNYKLTGLSRGRTKVWATLLERAEKGQEVDAFTAEVNMTQDRLNALWDYCKGNWDERKMAVLKDGKVVEITI